VRALLASGGLESASHIPESRIWQQLLIVAILASIAAVCPYV